MKAVNVNDVLKILHKYGTFIFVTDSKKYSDMENEIANLPSVTPKQRTGHWINDENIIGCYYCSECGGYNNSYDDAYCKYCGAKMEGDNNGN